MKCICIQMSGGVFLKGQLEGSFIKTLRRGNLNQRRHDYSKLSSLSLLLAYSEQAEMTNGIISLVRMNQAVHCMIALM